MQKPVSVAIVALDVTAASSLYGFVDVLNCSGGVWDALTGGQGDRAGNFQVTIVGHQSAPYTIGMGALVQPGATFATVAEADIVIVPEMWIGPQDAIHGRYDEAVAWIQDLYAQGACLYSACSGALLLAETGLVNGQDITTHWGYGPLMQQCYPAVCFCPDRTLAFAGEDQRIVSAGGGTAWHDLVLHIIARHVGQEEAFRIARIFLLTSHGDGQLPFTPMIRNHFHADGVVRKAQDWLDQHYSQSEPVAAVVENSGIPERSFKRRFKKATTMTVIDYVQSLRIERAKTLLESTERSVEETAIAVGYEDGAFFRRLFKRKVGLSPGRYRQMFQNLLPSLEYGG